MVKPLNRTILFESWRKSLFAGTYRQTQVDGINKILEEWDRRQLTDLRWLAAILATAFWETTQRMVPVSEDGGNAYLFRMYDIEGERPGVAQFLGNLFPGDGILFGGRGLPQLTGRENYRKMGAILKIPLEQNPDLALDPVWSVKIMFEGMLRADSNFGDFTGVALEDFFSPTKEDWPGSRKVVNGTDHAHDIAAIGKKFYAGIVAAV